MNEVNNTASCTIIGAGISGLMAANTLKSHGLSLRVLDKGRGVGGRMSTRHIDYALCDHGAQFFTVRQPEFREIVDKWEELGIVREWCSGFADSVELATEDGHARYIGCEGMNTIPKYLANDIDVRVNERAVSIVFRQGNWIVRTENKSIYRSDSLILTPPVPQSLALLDTGDVCLAKMERDSLETIRYEPCIALMVLLANPSSVPQPGGLQNPTQDINWISDNQIKGISQTPCITIHASPEFSKANWNGEDAEITGQLLKSAEEWLNFPVVEFQIHKWRYAKPIQCYPAPALTASGLQGLVFAGDAFGAPRVEGAAISGISAAKAIIEAMNGSISWGNTH